MRANNSHFFLYLFKIIASERNTNFKSSKFL